MPLSLTVMVAFGIMLYGFSVFLTDGAAGGEFSTGLLSVAYGGGLVAGGALAYPIGRRADSTGVRSIFGLGAVLGAGGLTLFSFATEPWQVLVAWWALIGPAGAMTFYEPAFVAVDRWCAKEQRAKALAVLTLIGGLAGIIFLPGIERLISLLGWRMAVRALAALLLVTGGSTALFFLRREPPLKPVASSSAGFSLRIDPARSAVCALHGGDGLELGWRTGGAFAPGGAIRRGGFAGGGRCGLGGVCFGAQPARAVGSALPGTAIPPYHVQAAVLVLMTVASMLMIDGTADWQLSGHFIIFGLSFGTVLPLGRW